MKTIIVSGADEGFAPLLLDLVRSLNGARVKPFDGIGILDVGLSEASVAALRPNVTGIVEPGWDFAIDPGLRAQKPHLRATLSRPFLRDYFPGYDAYLWMDADTWVQDAYALTWLTHAAQQGPMVLASHLDRSYLVHRGVTQWRLGTLHKYFSDAETALLVMQAYYNAGVFCIRENAPHWPVWRRYMERALSAAPDLISDQIPLNYALWKERLPVYPLPAVANWCCHLARPRLRADGRLYEPHLPHRRIGIVHLTADTKDRHVSARIGGKLLSRSLRYGSPLADVAAAPKEPPLDPATTEDAGGAAD